MSVGEKHTLLGGCGAPLGLLALAALASACAEPGPDVVVLVPDVSEPAPDGSEPLARVELNAPGPRPSEHALYGDRVAGLADLDGDGVRDFAVTAAGQAVEFAGGSYQGQVSVRSGKSGALLFVLENPDPQLQAPDRLFGHSLLGLGDLDGDGIGEIAVGSRRWDGVAIDQGRIYLYRGADGSLLRTIDGPADGTWFGDGLTRAADVDGDGTRDLLVTAPSSGRAYLVSPRSGEVLRVFRSPALGAFFGWSSAWLGDIDGDGLGDIALGEVPTGVGQPRGGRVYLFSGTGALLSTIDSPTPDDWFFGSGLGALGDIDGDGVNDFAMTGIQGLTVASGAKLGTALYSLPTQGAYWGEVISVLPDLDCDGVRDFVVSGRDCATSGSIYAYSGKTGTPYVTFAPPGLNTRARFSISMSLLDQHPDGSLDLAVGASGEGPLLDAGGVFVVRLDPEPGCEPPHDAVPDTVVALP